MKLSRLVQFWQPSCILDGFQMVGLSGFQMTLKNRTIWRTFHHLKSRLVRYSDPHCISKFGCKPSCSTSNVSTNSQTQVHFYVVAFFAKSTQFLQVIKSAKSSVYQSCDCQNDQSDQPVVRWKPIVVGAGCSLADNRPARDLYRHGRWGCCSSSCCCCRDGGRSVVDDRYGLKWRQACNLRDNVWSSGLKSCSENSQNENALLLWGSKIWPFNSVRLWPVNGWKHE